MAKTQAANCSTLCTAWRCFSTSACLAGSSSSHGNRMRHTSIAARTFQVFVLVHRESDYFRSQAVFALRIAPSPKRLFIRAIAFSRFWVRCASGENMSS